MVKGITVERVRVKGGRDKGFVCPMTQDQYVRQAQRECVVTVGINPAYAAWVSRRAAGSRSDG